MFNFKEHFSPLQRALKCHRICIRGIQCACLLLPLLQHCRCGGGEPDGRGPLPDPSACPQCLPPPATACSQLSPYINQQQSQSGGPDHQELALHAKTGFRNQTASYLRQQCPDAQTEPCYVLLWGFYCRNAVNKWINQRLRCIYVVIFSFIKKKGKKNNGERNGRRFVCVCLRCYI